MYLHKENTFLPAFCHQNRDARAAIVAKVALIVPMVMALSASASSAKVALSFYSGLGQLPYSIVDKMRCMYSASPFETKSS